MHLILFFIYGMIFLYSLWHVHNLPKKYRIVFSLYYLMSAIIYIKFFALIVINYMESMSILCQYS